MRRRFAACLLLAVLVGSLVAVPHVEATATTKWTFFVYMLADNDLECFALMNMQVNPTSASAPASAAARSPAFIQFQHAGIAL